MTEDSFKLDLGDPAHINPHSEQWHRMSIWPHGRRGPYSEIAYRAEEHDTCPICRDWDSFVEKWHAEDYGKADVDDR